MLFRALIDSLLEDFSLAQYEDKLRSAWALSQRPGTPEEGEAALRAYDRLKEAVIAKFGQAEFDRIDKKIKGGSSSSSGGARPGGSSRPGGGSAGPRPGGARPGSSGAPGGGDNFFVHENWEIRMWRFTDPNAGVRGSDKVWGYAAPRGSGVSTGIMVKVFWGGYGKKLASQDISMGDAMARARGKESNGYKKVDARTVDSSRYGWFLSQVQFW